jgi:hypothetical protein
LSGVRGFEATADGSDFDEAWTEDVAKALGRVTDVGLYPLSWANYDLFKVSSTYYRRNGITGIVDDSNADASTLAQAALDALPEAGGKIRFYSLGVATEFILNTGLTTDKQNVHVEGMGWSVPWPTWSHAVFQGLSLVTLRPSATFPPNDYVMTFNDPDNMTAGCSFKNIAIDGRDVWDAPVANVGGVHVANAINFIYDSVVVNRVTGSCVMCDQAGATYAPASISQLWFTRFQHMNSGRDGIEFGNNFMTDVYISDFFMSGLSRYGIETAVGTGNYGIYIYDGNIETSLEGLHLTSYETHVHNMRIHNNWNHGIYVLTTPAWSYPSTISNCTLRDNDRNVNGSSQIIIDTGSYGYHLKGNTCVKQDNGGEIGINIVPGRQGVNNNFVYADNWCSGHTTSQFVIATVNYNVARYPDIRNLGTATILNGNNSIVVAHGMAGTPSKVSITGTHAEVESCYVDTVGAANFTAHKGGAGNVTANRDVYWDAEYEP